MTEVSVTYAISEATWDGVHELKEKQADNLKKVWGLQRRKVSGRYLRWSYEIHDPTNHLEPIPYPVHAPQNTQCSVTYAVWIL